MTKLNTERFSRLLQEQESRVREALEADAGDVAELKAEWQEKDSPSENNLRAVEWDQFTGLRDELKAIEEAKERLASGTYGICRECEKEIGEKRLEAVTTATLCLECQEKSEREQGIAGKRASL